MEKALLIGDEAVAAVKRELGPTISLYRNFEQEIHEGRVKVYEHEDKSIEIHMALPSPPKNGWPDFSDIVG